MGQNYVPKIYKRPPAVSLKNFGVSRGIQYSKLVKLPLENQHFAS